MNWNEEQAKGEKAQRRWEDLEEENRKLRAEVAELRKTIEQIADHEDDVYRALTRSTEARHAGIRAADKAAP